MQLLPSESSFTSYLAHTRVIVILRFFLQCQGGPQSQLPQPTAKTYSLQAALPYLTLPPGDDVLPPRTEASNGPNAHPRINRKVTKFPTDLDPHQ